MKSTGKHLQSKQLRKKEDRKRERTTETQTSLNGKDIVFG